MNRSVGRLGALVVLGLSWQAAFAAPVLSGLYRVGDLGVVDFSIQDGRVVGRLKLAGVCPIAPDVQVVTGAFEGSVFVGEVLLCQEGPSCGPEKKYPVLGVWRDDAVVGSIKLDTGCRSSALASRTLKIVPASVDEKKKALEGQSGSAAAVAAQKTPKVGSEGQMEEALEAGQKAVAQGDFAVAREAFGRALSYDDSKWPAHWGLGLSRLKLGDATGGLESLERAESIASKVKADVSLLEQIQYNIACAHLALGHKAQAIATLRVIAKEGATADIIDGLEHDPDLAGLRSDIEFRRLVADMRLKARKTK